MQSQIKSMARMREKRSAFTLVEMLVVMAIIAILAALVLLAGNGVMQKGMRSRASAEIQAMSTALESYKTDNGIYPPYGAAGFVTNSYSGTAPEATGSSAYYLVSSETLYAALSGQTNFLDTHVSANKSYMSFKANQLGNTSATAGTPGDGTTTYVKDPFGLSYGYSTGYVSGTQTNYPYNGNGFFDLWSTGGMKGTTASNTNSWISNWQ
jgi:prepilin-type N-terminal cleavage/methylation domain-containing protein